MTMTIKRKRKECERRGIMRQSEQTIVNKEKGMRRDPITLLAH
jgi:hypothetical protein